MDIDIKLGWDQLYPLASDDVCIAAGSETVEVDSTVFAAAKSIDIGAGAKLVVKGLTVRPP